VAAYIRLKIPERDGGGAALARDRPTTRALHEHRFNESHVQDIGDRRRRHQGRLPAAFLAKLEERLDAPIGSYFDLIAGTSTGGIIAIGLGLGLTAAEILKLYEEQGPAIFD
jgi:hypothetical protein